MGRYNDSVKKKDVNYRKFIYIFFYVVKILILVFLFNDVCLFDVDIDIEN